MWLALLLLAGDPTTQKAVDYLSREVPAWRAENGCFSCHNNGDGARALFLARKMGYRVAASSLTETQRWLNSPADWDTKSKRPEASDLKLARLQFAVAASSPGASRACATGRVPVSVPNRSALPAMRATCPMDVSKSSPVARKQLSTRFAPGSGPARPARA